MHLPPGCFYQAAAIAGGLGAGLSLNVASDSRLTSRFWITYSNAANYSTQMPD